MSQQPGQVTVTGEPESVTQEVKVVNEVGDPILSTKSATSLLFWYGWTVLNNCCGLTMWNFARAAATFAIVIVVAGGAYDIITQDFLFGSQVTDLYLYLFLFLFAIYVFHVIDTAFRGGFIIIDPHTHWAMFLFFLFGLVVAVGLSVVINNPGSIALAPGAVNPYTGTSLHQGMYVFLMVLLWLMTLNNLGFWFSSMYYWGTVAGYERLQAFRAYRDYYHKHGHLVSKTVSLGPGWTNTTPMSLSYGAPQNTKAQSMPLLQGYQQQQMNIVEMQKLAQLQSLTSQNAALASTLQQQQQRQQQLDLQAAMSANAQRTAAAAKQEQPVVFTT